MMQDNKKETYKPILSLNMDDKIYLAVSKDLTDKLSFVYTLACLKQNKNSNDRCVKCAIPHAIRANTHTSKRPVK